MGEAIIARGNVSRSDPLENVNVVSGYCSLLVKALDSFGRPISNLPVWCKDGTRSYNYNTNESGFVLFQCNSGAANITAQNYSLLDKYNIIDQSPSTANFDAPVGTKKYVNIKLNPIDSNISITKNMIVKFLGHNKANRVVTIGGGAAGCNNGNGGGGGAYNEIRNIALDGSIKYNFYVAAGGTGDGGAGGTTTALGISSVGGSGITGGGSGTYRGGNGHKTSGGYNGSNYPSELAANYHNNSDPFTNYGFGGGRGSYYTLGSVWNGVSWNNYTNIIARGGHYSYRWNDSKDDYQYWPTSGSGAPIYGGGGGGASKAYGGGANTGSGGSGIILINF